MEIIAGGITAAKGFYAAATAAGIKYENRDDMAMIYSEVPAVTAGAFTKNIVKAAPVIWDREMVANHECARAVVINAGIANACTGREGMSYCKDTADFAAQQLKLAKDEILIASTGVIGKKLPMDNIKLGIEKLAVSLKADLTAGNMAARGIMTTDTVEKEAAVTVRLKHKKVTIGGMCKGSGMIHPDMCTMLSFITTDAAIGKELLAKALREDIENTYNMVSVDGDTSTNDTVLLMANGMAGNEPIREENEDYRIFKAALHYVNETLSKKIAADGEGATALFETKVIHADTKENARLLAKSVICSSLTKAAIYGHDANWGRIMCAMGYAGADFNPECVELSFQSKSGEILIYQDGAAVDYSEEEATKILSEDQVRVLVDLKNGNEEATAWGCDLTYDYVKINADYRS